MALVSISRLVSTSVSDIYIVPPGTPTQVSTIRIVALEASEVTVYRYQTIDQTLYELVPPTKLDKNGTYESLNIVLNPGDKIVAKASNSSVIIHIFGFENS